MLELLSHYVEYIGLVRIGLILALIVAGMVVIAALPSPSGDHSYSDEWLILPAGGVLALVGSIFMMSCHFRTPSTDGLVDAARVGAQTDVSAEVVTTRLRQLGVNEEGVLYRWQVPDRTLIEQSPRLKRRHVTQTLGLDDSSSNEPSRDQLCELASLILGEAAVRQGDVCRLPANISAADFVGAMKQLS